MDTYSYVAAAMDALIRRDPVEILIAMAVLLSAPLILIWTRSIFLSALTIAATSVPVLFAVSAAEPPIVSLWLACVWLALNCLHIAAVLNHRNLLMGQDLLERMSEMDYRINTFLDALDRRGVHAANGLDTHEPVRVKESAARRIHEDAL